MPTAIPSDAQLVAEADDLGGEALILAALGILRSYPVAGRQDAPGQAHPDPLGDEIEVGPVLDDDVHRLGEGLGVDLVGPEQQQRPRPVDRLGDRRRLLEVELADHGDDLDDPASPSSSSRSGA